MARQPWPLRALLRAASLRAVAALAATGRRDPRTHAAVRGEHPEIARQVPARGRRVTDLTKTLDAAQATALEGKLAAFDARKGSQFAVLMLPTAKPEAIEQYSLRVAEAWKIGGREVDDSALLLVAKDGRALRIEVGYGLQGALSDAIPGASSTRRSCRAIVGKGWAAGIVGTGIGLIPWSMSGVLLVAVVAALIALFLTLAGTGTRGDGGWSSSGGRSSGGGSSGGSWGGGGGGFGGGGASGRW